MRHFWCACACKPVDGHGRGIVSPECVDRWGQTISGDTPSSCPPDFVFEPCICSLACPTRLTGTGRRLRLGHAATLLFRFSRPFLGPFFPFLFLSFPFFSFCLSFLFPSFPSSLLPLFSSLPFLSLILFPPLPGRVLSDSGRRILAGRMRGQIPSNCRLRSWSFVVAGHLSLSKLISKPVHATATTRKRQEWPPAERLAGLCQAEPGWCGLRQAEARVYKRSAWQG